MWARMNAYTLTRHAAWLNGRGLHVAEDGSRNEAPHDDLQWNAHHETYVTTNAAERD